MDSTCKMLTITNYDEKNFLVFGDRNKYKKQINLLGGRWNSKKNGWIVPIINKNKLEKIIEGEKNYHREDSDNDSEDIEKDESEKDEVDNTDTVSKELFKNEPDIEEKINMNSSFKNIEDDNEEKRRKEKILYEEKRFADYRRREEENRLREKLRREEIKRKEEENNAKNKYGKKDPMLYNRSFTEEEDPYKYYKSFNKKPVDFRRLNNISESESESESESDVESSSTEYSESSSDGFPSPSTPKRKYQYREDYNDLCYKLEDLQKRVYMIENNHRRR